MADPSNFLIREIPEGLPTLLYMYHVYVHTWIGRMRDGICRWRGDSVLEQRSEMASYVVRAHLMAFDLIFGYMVGEMECISVFRRRTRLGLELARELIVHGWYRAGAGGL